PHQGHYDDALALLTVVIQKDPNHYAAHRTKGLCLLRTDHAADAISALEFSLKANPRDAAVLTWIGEAYAALGKSDEALRAFEAAVEASPSFGDAWRAKGLLHMKLEQFPADAVVRFEKHLTRPATRDEIFRYCSVPLDTLDEVVKYVNEPAPLAPDRIEAEDLRKFEAVGAAVLQHVENARTLDALRLSDVSMVLPHVDLEEARTIWGYIDWVRDAPLEPTPEWHNDDLIRQALDLPKEEWNLVDLA